MLTRTEEDRRGILGNGGPGIQLSEHLHGDASEIFPHACKLGCEGIVSKRLGSRYVSGRCEAWIKIKNPSAPAVKREAEEDWGREMKQNSGARYEIALDGKPRSYRDEKPVAIEAAEFLKRKNSQARVTVHDLEAGQTVIIEAPRGAHRH